MHNEVLIKKFLDVKDCIDIILKRTRDIKSFSEFVKDDSGIERFDSVMMRLQVIGEILKNIEKKNPNFLTSYPEINWKQAMGLRDVISHQYLEIDEEEIYNICKNDLPRLKRAIDKIINELK